MGWNVTVGIQVRSRQGLGTIETIVDSLVWILVITLVAKTFYKRIHVTCHVIMRNKKLHFKQGKDSESQVHELTFCNC